MSNASIETEISYHIGKASGSFARMSAKFWDNPKLTIRTKLDIYHACFSSTLLYGSKVWTLSNVKEEKINTFHQQCLCYILRIRWQQNITTEEVLRRTGLTTIRQCRLGHVLRISNRHIPKDLLYSYLVVGKHNIGQP